MYAVICKVVDAAALFLMVLFWLLGISIARTGGVIFFLFLPAVRVVLGNSQDARWRLLFFHRYPRSLTLCNKCNNTTAWSRRS